MQNSQPKPEYYLLKDKIIILKAFNKEKEFATYKLFVITTTPCTAC